MIYVSRIKKRPTFEELIQDLQNFDKLIKYPNRKATRIKEWVDMLNLNISSPVNFVDEQIKQIFEDKAVQTELLKLADKATQTDINEKGIQVDITPIPLKYTKLLGSYEGPDVIDDSGWFSFKKKRKATQTLRFGSAYDYPISYTPPSPPSPPLSSSPNARPTEIPDLINPLINAFFAPLNFGLGILNDSPVNSNISVQSSPPISVHSSPPISIASSSTSKISSPPISVASSHPISVASSHHITTPVSPSYLPDQSEPNTPASSSSRRSRRSK